MTVATTRFTKIQFALIVLLLLAQLFLRTHNPWQQPAFVDEGYHVQRAEIIYKFDRNPVGLSHGKLLFYYWLGLFALHDDSALVVGRLTVALFSLLTSTTCFAIARRLFGPRAALPTLAFYALVPYTIFFERMALADPFAGGLATLSVWQSIRLARSPAPSRALGALVGLLVALTLLAKLTMLFIVALPFVAVFLLSDIRPSTWHWNACGIWLRDIWQRYRRAWIATVFTGLIPWCLYFLGMIAYHQSGKQPRFFTHNLIDGSPNSTNLLQNIELTFVNAAVFLTTVVVFSLVILAVLLVWQRPTTGGFVLIWMMAVWLPIIIFGNPVRTRYLMAGIPAWAVILGGGYVVLCDMVCDKQRPYPTVTRHIDQVALSLLGTWAVLFALPFAWRAATDPANLKLTEHDTYHYLSGPYTGWGAREALNFLIEHGETLPVTWREQTTDRIPAVGVLHRCDSIQLHVTDDFVWSCVDARDFPIRAIPADVSEWEPLMYGVETWPFVYLVTEFSGIVPDELAQEWELLFTSSRPFGGWTIAVWRVTTNHE